jgi:hypothetical protein
MFLIATNWIIFMGYFQMFFIIPNINPKMNFIDLLARVCFFLKACGCKKERIENVA